MGSGAGGHGNQTLNKGLHAPITWKFPDAAARAAFVPTQGLPALTTQLDADDIDKWALQEDDGTFWRLTVISPLTWVRVNLNAVPHGVSHENGGADEIDVTGLSGLLADPQIPVGHNSTHENGGVDEMSVSGLSGLLADPQTPLGHEASHHSAGADALSVLQLAGFPGGTTTFLRADGSFAQPNGRGARFWGNGSIAATTTTRYLTPSYEDSSAPTTPIQYRVLRDGTFSTMRVRHNSPAGNGNAVVYTLRVNGVATALTVSMASTANDGSDLTHSVAVSAGDLIDIEVTKAASIGATPTEIILNAEFS